MLLGDALPCGDLEALGLRLPCLEREAESCSLQRRNPSASASPCACQIPLAVKYE